MTIVLLKLMKILFQIQYSLIVTIPVGYKKCIDISGLSY
jgi:hypothetical protein